MANLENCERFLETISHLIKRGGDNIIYTEEDSTAEIPKFDHSRCSDCSYGYSITCDCSNHLSALQKQALEANMRLQSLVEMREKMAEASEELSMSLAAASVGKSGGDDADGLNTFLDADVSEHNSHSNDTIDDATAKRMPPRAHSPLSRTMSTPTSLPSPHSHEKSFNSKSSADAVLKSSSSSSSNDKKNGTGNRQTPT